MEIKNEKLSPILIKLLKKYTSNESSSVSKETAIMITNSILYCINETTNKNNIAIPNFNEDLETLYNYGYNMVLEKINKSKELYNIILENFTSYGIKNYYDTIIKGIPEFFINYNPKYDATNNILTFDYPLLSVKKVPSNLCGIDLLYEYLKNILIEMKFLSNYDTYEIQSVLNRIIPAYSQDLYLDNITYPILLIVLIKLLMKAEAPLLDLSCDDLYLIKDALKDDSIHDIKMRLDLILKKLFKDSAYEYFKTILDDYSNRLYYAVKHNCLNNLLYVY